VTYELTLTPPHCRPRPNDYDDWDLPRQSKRAGRAWAEIFAHLSPDQQRTIVNRMVVGTARAKARRLGRPSPIFLTADGRALPAALGGDGRGPEHLGREVEPVDPNCDALKLAAEAIRAQLREIDPDHPLVRVKLAPSKKRTG
jgi:hypothetical protein